MAREILTSISEKCSVAQAWFNGAQKLPKSTKNAMEISRNLAPSKGSRGHFKGSTRRQTAPVDTLIPTCRNSPYFPPAQCSCFVSKSLAFEIDPSITPWNSSLSLDFKGLFRLAHRPCCPGMSRVDFARKMLFSNNLLCFLWVRCDGLLFGNIMGRSDKQMFVEINIRRRRRRVVALN